MNNRHNYSSKKKIDEISELKIMNCPHCGHEMFKEYDICPICGYQLIDKNSPSQNMTIEKLAIISSYFYQR